jgi:N-acetylglucosaminyldiphosphoundecaprenol N-acetyl-beta-D-mannosaminyltransferase
MSQSVSRFDVLGVEIDALNPTIALSRLEDLVEADDPAFIVFCTVSTVVAAARDAELQVALEDAAVVTPDGMPLVWLGRRQGHAVERVYGPDFLVEVMEKTGGAYRHFFYGGAPGVADRMADQLRSRFPEIQVAGTFSPPFGADIQDETIWKLEDVAATSPDIVWVGLGHPRQEKWMRVHQRALAPAVAAGVGAAFDFLSGDKQEAPIWMKDRGLQWAHRLAHEPGRLWRRYLIGNSTFVARLTWQQIRRFGKRGK